MLVDGQRDFWMVVSLPKLALGPQFPHLQSGDGNTGMASLITLLKGSAEVRHLQSIKLSHTCSILVKNCTKPNRSFYFPSQHNLVISIIEYAFQPLHGRLKDLNG